MLGGSGLQQAIDVVSRKGRITWAKLSALAAENGIEIPPTEEE